MLRRTWVESGTNKEGGGGSWRIHVHRMVPLYACAMARSVCLARGGTLYMHTCYVLSPVPKEMKVSEHAVPCSVARLRPTHSARCRVPLPCAPPTGPVYDASDAAASAVAEVTTHRGLPGGRWCGAPRGSVVA